MSSSTCARARAAGAPRASAGGHSKRSPERSERHTDVLHQRSAPRGAGRRADVASGAAPGNLAGQAHDQPVNQRSGIMSHETMRSEEHTSELQSLAYLVCRLLLEKK